MSGPEYKIEDIKVTDEQLKAKKAELLAESNYDKFIDKGKNDKAKKEMRDVRSELREWKLDYEEKHAYRSRLRNALKDNDVDAWNDTIAELKEMHGDKATLVFDGLHEGTTNDLSIRFQILTGYNFGYVKFDNISFHKCVFEGCNMEGTRFGREANSYVLAAGDEPPANAPEDAVVFRKPDVFTDCTFYVCNMDFGGSPQSEPERPLASPQFSEAVQEAALDIIVNFPEGMNPQPLKKQNSEPVGAPDVDPGDLFDGTCNLVKNLIPVGGLVEGAAKGNGNVIVRLKGDDLTKFDEGKGVPVSGSLMELHNPDLPERNKSSDRGDMIEGQGMIYKPPQLGCPGGVCI